ncbi:hypothetical protein [Muricoccus vinaceus]|uniref:DUF222 domain-containing protein n=1 Tax=Muricoccus vinaceus TaxID=424704 RepID=A0ABV6IL60_9PROT
MSKPPGLGTLCSTYGLLVAQGVVEREDAWEAVWTACRQAGSTEADRLGSPLRIGTAQQVTEAALRWELARGKAEHAIRKAIGSLISEWAEPTAILARAHEVNHAHAGRDLAGQHIGPLLAKEVRAIVSEEVAWWLRRQPGKKRRHVR